MKIKPQVTFWAGVLAAVAPCAGGVAEVAGTAVGGEGVPEVRWELTQGVEREGARRVALRVEVGCAGVAGEGKAANVVVVLDRSATMAGEKLEAARGAIAGLAGQLGAADRFGLVVYDDLVEVVRPSGPVARGEGLALALGQLEAGGGTAMFGGLAKGLAELRRHSGEGRVSRLVLISDGRAGLGPGSISAMRELGRGAREEALSVTTIGLGFDYHEVLLASLARESGGWHRMVEVAGELGDVLIEELDDVRGVRFDPLWLGFEPGLGVGLVGLGASGGGGQLGEGRVSSEVEGASLVALPPVGEAGRVAWVELELGEGFGGGGTGAVAGLGDIVVWGQEVGGAVVEVRAEVKVSAEALADAGEVNRGLLVELGKERALRRGQAAAYYEAAGEQERARAELLGNTRELLSEANQLGAGELWEEAAASHQLSLQLEAGGAGWERNRKELQAVPAAQVGRASASRGGGGYGAAGGRDRMAEEGEQGGVRAAPLDESQESGEADQAELREEAPAMEAAVGAAAVGEEEVAELVARAEGLVEEAGEEHDAAAPVPRPAAQPMGIAPPPVPAEEVAADVVWVEAPVPGGLVARLGSSGDKGQEPVPGATLEVAQERAVALPEGSTAMPWDDAAGGAPAEPAARAPAGEVFFAGEAPMADVAAEPDLAGGDGVEDGAVRAAESEMAQAAEEVVDDAGAPGSGGAALAQSGLGGGGAKREAEPAREMVRGQLLARQEARKVAGELAGEVERLLGEAAELGAAGDRAGARAHYGAVLRLEPGNEMALWGLKLLDAIEAGELGGR